MAVVVIQIFVTYFEIMLHSTCSFVALCVSMFVIWSVVLIGFYSSSTKLYRVRFCKFGKSFLLTYFRLRLVEMYYLCEKENISIILYDF